MTLEQKAAAYDEALEHAKKVNKCEADDREPGTSICEYIFPELAAESEDERIRKEIISFIQDDINEINLKVSGDYDDRDKEDIAHQNWCKKAITWLEKQNVNKLNTTNIKSCIGMILTDADEQRFKDYNTNLAACLAWLKRQGEEKPIDWSDYDRTIAFTLMRDIDQMTCISKKAKDERIGWLNSLDEKFINYD